jgi:hypothetical protein
MSKISIGDTFQGDNSHIYFVITDPADNSGEVIIVNATTLRDGSDRSCILTHNDHSDLTVDSCIFYKAARIEKATTIENVLRGKIYKRRPASPETIKKIQEGALESDHFPPKIKRFLQQTLKRT